jgi:hypothetical protein
MTYNSRIRRLQSFHRPPAQAVEACAVFRRVVQANARAYLRPLRGARMMPYPRHVRNFLIQCSGVEARYFSSTVTPLY